MELYLSGLAPADFEPQTWVAMRAHAINKEHLEYLKFNTIIAAIIHAGKMAAGAETGKFLSDTLRSYKDALFPELQKETLEKSKRVEKIIKEEASKGPIKFKALAQPKKRQRR